MDADLTALLARMPKAELHLHLDGSLRPQTALELARERGLDEGMDVDAMRARLTAPERCQSQAELLRAFDLPIALMQDAEALERITGELVEDVARDGTRYVEIRWAPTLHVERGLSLHDGINAVVAGAQAGAASTGVVTRLIAVALRSHDPELNRRMAEEAVRFVDSGLTGFDCAGQEERFPDPLLHEAAFDVARAGGLGITVHAGEWGGTAQIWRALQVDPARIAHGPGTIDDPELQAELIARDITLDLCPTSNVQANLVASVAAHPIARLHRAGVPVTLSTDDRTVSGVTLVREYGNVVREAGLTLTELWAIDRHALEVAFLHHDEGERQSLRAEFDAFAASEPHLAPAAN
ncbi:MAG: adenosine deaminase [Chloroflexota bacterium]|nr:adenosine deaminase [Chloroflexota bacterium]